MKTIGHIELYRVEGGRWLPVLSCCNSMVYSGYDAMARAFAGDPDYAVSGMYVEYKNSAPSEPVIPATRKTDYYEALVAPYGYVRMRTLSAPLFTASDATKYEGNVVTFTGVTDGTSAGGAPIIDGTSQFFSLALVAMPDYAERRFDTLVSAAAVKSSGVFAPVTKQANSQLGFRWSLQLGA